MKNRDRSRREWRRRQTGNAHDRFKHLRNSAQEMIRAARSNRDNSNFSAQTSAASTWKELRSLGLVKSRGSVQPLVVSVSYLNRHFASAGVDCAYSPPQMFYLGEAPYSDDRFYFQNFSYEV